MTLQEDDVAGGRDAGSEAAASVRWFVITSTLEGLADSLSRTLLPIVAIITLGAGTGLVGVINSLGLIAFLLLGLPIGILADRADTPRRIMTASTLVRAGVAAGALACWGIGWLHGIPGVAVLVVAALTIGVADVFYTTGQSLLVSKLAAPDHIRTVFGRMHSGAQAGTVAGPPLLSGLLLLAAAPVAWVAPAVVYLLSAVTQRRIHKPLPVASPRPDLRISRVTAGGSLPKTG